MAGSGRVYGRRHIKELYPQPLGVMGVAGESRATSALARARKTKAFVFSNCSGRAVGARGCRACSGMKGGIYVANALPFFYFLETFMYKLPLASPGSSLGTVPETAVVYAAENHFKVYGILCLYVKPYLTGTLGG